MRPDTPHIDAAPSRLLDQVRAAIRVQHYILRTEQAYVNWIVCFIRHCGMRHPSEVSGYLSYLASERELAVGQCNGGPIFEQSRIFYTV